MYGPYKTKERDTYLAKKKKKRKQQERTIERTANELEITWPQLEIINEEIEKLKALEEEFGEEEY